MRSRILPLAAALLIAIALHPSRAAAEEVALRCTLHDFETDSIRQVNIDIDMTNHRVDGHFAQVRGDMIAWHAPYEGSRASFRLKLATFQLVLARKGSLGGFGGCTPRTE